MQLSHLYPQLPVNQEGPEDTVALPSPPSEPQRQKVTVTVSWHSWKEWLTHTHTHRNILEYWHIKESKISNQNLCATLGIVILENYVLISFKCYILLFYL